MIKEEVLEIIRKVLALTTSPNEHEAALAAIRVRELMDKYNVEMKDISQDVKEVVEEVDLELGNEARVYWVNVLVNIVGKYQSCRAYKTGRNGLAIVGFTSDLELFEYTFIYLRRTIERLLEQAEVPKEVKVRKYLDSYAYGIVCNLGERFRQERENVMKGRDDRALVVVDRKKTVDKYCNENLHLTTSRSSTTYNPLGYANGYTAGKQIVLRNGVGEEKSNGIRRLE